ncbi:hypothetical protein F4808DRAFT_421247 [Astrocystis sublimbata]|nr:hypothetical protein F4808DRAFT_421247 [Astrocystis sublimbata]
MPETRPEDGELQAVLANTFGQLMNPKLSNIVEQLVVPLREIMAQDEHAGPATILDRLLSDEHSGQLLMLMQEVSAGVHNIDTDDPLRARFTRSRNIVFSYASSNPPPAVMHVCRESRALAPYRRAFFSPTAAGIKYIWVNFHHDMICLPDDQVQALAPYYADIERLRVTGGYRVEYEMKFSWLEHYFFNNDKRSNIWLGWDGGWTRKPFSSLKELHVASHGDILGWYRRFTGFWFSEDDPYKVSFLDLNSGLLLSGNQMKSTGSWKLLKGGKAEHLNDSSRDWLVYFGPDHPFPENEYF